MDVVVERWCRKRGLAVPVDVETKSRLHLEALGGFVDRLEQRRAAYP
jgi:hypothetical protein